MNIAITKLLLTDKLISSLCLFSLVISLLMVYSDLSDNLFSYYLGNCITLLLILVCIVGEVFEIESNRARIINKHSVLACVGKILLLSGHPTIWTIEYNNILHLLMMLRLVFTLNYFIRSSVYYDSRASRLINIYGIKPEYNYFFAIKVILNQM